MTDQAIQELRPMIGIKGACAVVVLVIVGAGKPQLPTYPENSPMYGVKRDRTRGRPAHRRWRPQRADPESAPVARDCRPIARRVSGLPPGASASLWNGPSEMPSSASHNSNM